MNNMMQPSNPAMEIVSFFSSLFYMLINSLIHSMLDMMIRHYIAWTRHRVVPKKRKKIISTPKWEVCTSSRRHELPHSPDRHPLPPYDFYSMYVSFPILSQSLLSL